MKNKREDKSNWPIPAGLFIGIGIGLITNQVAGFALIGLGFGFLIAFLLNRKRK